MLLPEPIRLSAGSDFELWIFELLIQPDVEMQAWLSKNEHRKAARFVFERDRRRYLVAHCMLRHLLSRRTAIPPAQLEFNDRPFGKPELRNVARCAFNLSHSEELAVVLIANQGEVGVDVEMIRHIPDALALAERNFSREEFASLSAVKRSERDHAFLTGWTRKEACLKAIGSGLSIAPNTFTAGLNHDPCTTTIPTPEVLATVTVQSFCYEGRCVVACAKIEPQAAR